jgi:hypothetical protein
MRGALTGIRHQSLARAHGVGAPSTTSRAGARLPPTSGISPQRTSIAANVALGRDDTNVGAKSKLQTRAQAGAMNRGRPGTDGVAAIRNDRLRAAGSVP